MDDRSIGSPKCFIYLVRNLQLLALRNVGRFGDGGFEAVESLVVQGLIVYISSANMYHIMKYGSWVLDTRQDD